jgi:hypothetical protein
MTMPDPHDESDAEFASKLGMDDLDVDDLDTVAGGLFNAASEPGSTEMRGTSPNPPTCPLSENH